jgi:hypothetical protein
MKRLHFRVPRIIGRLKPRPPIEPHDHTTLARFERAEGVLDTLIVVAMLVLVGFMIWGFVTSTGDQRWF